MDGSHFRNHPHRDVLPADLVDITPAPIFAGLERLNDRVLRFMEMFGCVLIFGGVATADVAADKAEAQMHPAIATRQAFRTTGRARRDVAYLISMCTVFHLFYPLPFLRGNDW